MRILSGLAVMGLVACDGGKDSGDTTTTFTPSEGEWSATEDAFTDSCGFFESDSDSSTVTLTMIDSVTFNVVDEEIDLTCTLDGMNFTCDNSTETISLKDKGLSGTLTSTSTSNGTFVSETEGSFVVTIDLTCDGDGCATIEEFESMTFPCAYSSELSLSFAG